MALEEIVKRKICEIEERKKEFPLERLVGELEKRVPVKRNFLGALLNSISNKKPGVIAEIKFASPSRGVIRKDLSPEDVAEIYERSPFVDCISVLTEKYYFNGDISFIRRVKEKSSKPVLRKDFIVDVYQVYESAYYEADCILLIASCLSKKELESLWRTARTLDLDVLVEVYEESDLEKVEKLDVEIIGVNSRNLRTLEVSFTKFSELFPKLPAGFKVMVAESGMKSKSDITNAIAIGFNAFLIGESFMSSNNIGEKIREMVEGVRLP
ncbi:MAG: indole-3-glycerol phosphate synthase TrpC [Brevinematia bacterium]